MNLPETETFESLTEIYREREREIDIEKGMKRQKNMMSEKNGRMFERCRGIKSSNEICRAVTSINHSHTQQIFCPDMQINV